ncbi:MAG: hypothetical protein AB1775_07580 [Bacteroidota bacterium]
MFDATVPKKDVIETISRMIKNAVPKEEIFSSVKNRYSEFNPDVLALRISAFVSDEIKSKYKLPVYLLVVSMIVDMVFGLLSLISMPPKKLVAAVWVVSVLFYIISILFIAGFLRYKLTYFTTAVSLYSLFLLLVIHGWIVYPFSGMLVLQTLDVVLTLLFLVLLRKSIFPNINFWGNVKKGVNKNYIF